MSVPAGTPPDIIAKLNAEIGRILQLPRSRDQLTNLGFGHAEAPACPGDFSNYLHAEVDKWRYVFKGRHTEREGIAVGRSPGRPVTDTNDCRAQTIRDGAARGGVRCR